MIKVLDPNANMWSNRIRIVLRETLTILIAESGLEVDGERATQRHPHKKL